MKGRTHLAITALVGGAYLFALYYSFVGALEGGMAATTTGLASGWKMAAGLVATLGAAWIGVLVGSLLPDADAEDALVFRKRVGGGYALKAAGLLTKWLAYKPVAWLGGRLWGKKWEGHRRLLHSLKGALLVFGFWLIGGLIMLGLFSAVSLSRLWLSFCLGLLFGFLLHVWEDSLTVAGVEWVKGVRLQGKIKTGYGGWRIWEREEGVLVLAFGMAVISLLASILGNENGFGGFLGFLAATSFFPLSWLLYARVPKLKKESKAERQRKMEARDSEEEMKEERYWSRLAEEGRKELEQRRL